MPPFSPPLNRVDPQQISLFLQQVEKPGRYSGGEFGIAGKDPAAVACRVALSYPDSYELGMSNQGLRILYDRINRLSNALAERIFLPHDDAAAALERLEIPLYSLEQKLTADSFHLWGFNVSHELHFTNLLHAFHLAGLPLRRRERLDHHPIVVVGGTAVSNPLPLLDIVDLIFLGDGEEAIVEMCAAINASLAAGESRAATLQRFGAIEGVLLASDTPPTEPVRPRLFRGADMNDFIYYPIPGIEVTQDRVVLEVSRGCGQGCRFCHAGFWKRPVRNSEVDQLLENCQRLLDRTGADSVSLHSLSLADYPHLEELVESISRRFGPQGVSLSLPSLRVDEKTLPLIEATSKIRKTNITFALEAGSELLRERIRKRATEEELQALLRQIFSRGWSLVKIYFMLGLPDPDQSEVDELIRALNELGRIAEQAGPRARINVTVSLFVPKPHTTFQWDELRTPEYFETAIRRLEMEVRSKRISLKYPSPWMSWIEGLFSRADRRAGELIFRAYQKGARFDSWDDKFREEIWRELIAELEPELIEAWSRPDNDPEAAQLPYEPWVEAIPRYRLLRDRERYLSVGADSLESRKERQRLRRESERNSVAVEERSQQGVADLVTLDERKTVSCGVLRIDLSRFGSAIYLSHLDAAEAVRRAARRAGVAMAFSRGHNKHERFHYQLPLPLYFHSRAEHYYVEIYEVADIGELHKRLKDSFPDGFELQGLALLEKLPPRLADASFRYQLTFSASEEGRALFERSVERLQSLPEEYSFSRDIRKKKRLTGRKKELQKRLASALSQLEMEVGKQLTIGLELEAPDSGAISISDLLVRYLELPPTIWNTLVKVERVGCHLPSPAKSPP